VVNSATRSVPPPFGPFYLTASVLFRQRVLPVFRQRVLPAPCVAPTDRPTMPPVWPRTARS